MVWKSKDQAWKEYLDALNVWCDNETDANWKLCEELFVIWYKL